MRKIRKSLRFQFVWNLIRFLRMKEFYAMSGDSFWDNVRQTRSPRASAPFWFQRLLMFLLRLDFEVCSSDEYSFPFYCLTPPQWDRKRTVLYLHGGGNVNEATKTHWFFLIRTAVRARARIVMPQYPLAPEYSCADALEMIREVYEKILETTSSDHVFLMGDSAGGGLTLSSAMLFRDLGLPGPRCLVMISPALEFGVSDSEFQPEIPNIEKLDPMLSFGSFSTILEKWRGPFSPGDWHAEPLFGDLEGLPPMTIFIGTSDILSLGARAFLKKVSKLNEEKEKRSREGLKNEQAPKRLILLEYREFPEMFHCWPLIPLPESREARNEIWEIIQSDREEPGKRQKMEESFF